MILHWRIRTGSDQWFSKILWIRTGSDSISSDQDWTRTEKFHSPDHLWYGGQRNWIYPLCDVTIWRRFDVWRWYGKVCWHSVHSILHALSLLLVV